MSSGPKPLLRQRTWALRRAPVWHRLGHGMPVFADGHDQTDDDDDDDDDDISAEFDTPIVDDGSDNAMAVDESLVPPVGAPVGRHSERVVDEDGLLLDDFEDSCTQARVARAAMRQKPIH